MAYRDNVRDISLQEECLLNAGFVKDAIDPVYRYRHVTAFYFAAQRRNDKERLTIEFAD
jgi:hypothetical protein